MLTKKEILLYNYMKEILETHPVTNLKSILRNIKGDIGSYSKMKKAELIDRIMELKKKGFPIPKVEKYVKPEKKPKKKAEKKPEPKKAGGGTKPEKPAPVQGPRNLVKGFGIKRTEKKSEPKIDVTNMNTKEYKKYLKNLPKKVPNIKDTKEVDEFLKAHEGIGYAWQFHKGKSANDAYLYEINTQGIYEKLSKKNKLRFLDLYLNKSNDELRSQLENPKGLSKPMLVQYVYNKPTPKELADKQSENEEMYDEIRNRYGPNAKTLKIGDKEGIEKARRLFFRLNRNNDDLFVYGGKFIPKRTLNKIYFELNEEPQRLKDKIVRYEKEVANAKARAKRAGREYNEATDIGVSNVLKG